MRRYLRLLAVVAVFGLLIPMLMMLGGTVGQAQAQGTTASTCPAGATKPTGPIKIGVILPLSGSAASAGNDEKAALDLAVKIINEATPGLNLPLAPTAGLPNLGGAKIQLVVMDSQGSAEVGQSDATHLINDDKVVALFGAYNSDVTKTSSAVAERAGIPYLNGASSSPQLTQRGYVWFFRTTPNDNTFAKSIFDFIDSINKAQPGAIKTVSLIYENTDFGVNSAAAERTDAAASDLTIKGDVKYDANATSLTSEVQALKAANADALIPSSYTSDAILTMKTAKQLGYLPKLIVAQDAGYSDPAFVSALGLDANGIASRSAFSIDIAQVKPAAAKVNQLYKAATGKDLYDVPARGFTGMMVLADAINRACSTAPDKIRAALAATNLGPNDTIMPWQGVKFDKTGQNTLGTGIIVQLQNGVFRTVYPANVATAKPIFPLTPWSQRK